MKWKLLLSIILPVLIIQGALAADDISRQFVNAIQKNDVAAINELIKSGANFENGNAMSALAYASTKGRLEIVSKLLNGGANPNGVLQNCDFPPLTRAAEGPIDRGDPDWPTYHEIMKLLISKGANVNHALPPSCSTGNGQTALMRATFEKNIAAFDILVSAGADPTAASGAGILYWDILAWAVNGRSPEMMEHIIEKFPDLAAKQLQNAQRVWNFFFNDLVEYENGHGGPGSEPEVRATFERMQKVLENLQQKSLAPKN